jgi:methionine-rich copper-binding protein CopC
MRRSWTRRFGLLWLCGLLAVASGAETALAHSELRRSSPAAGATLAAPPAEIALTFNEKVQVTAVRLFREGGAEVRLERPAAIAEAASATRSLPTLEAGAYRIEWRAISADGHPVGGVIRFRVSPPP